MMMPDTAPEERRRSGTPTKLPLEVQSTWAALGSTGVRRGCCRRKCRRFRRQASRRATETRGSAWAVDKTREQDNLNSVLIISSLQRAFLTPTAKNLKLKGRTQLELLMDAISYGSRKAQEKKTLFCDF